MNPVNTGAAGAKPALVTAIGVFPGYAEARRAVLALRQAGFQNEQIGVIGPEDRAADDERSGLANDPTHTHWEEGAGIGAAAGGLTGLGLGAAVAAGLMSPLGPVVAGGAVVALLASAGAGAVVGTVVGGLAGLGVPEDDARWYASELEAGRVVVTVRAADGAPARDVIAKYGGSGRPGRDIGVYGAGVGATPY